MAKDNEIYGLLKLPDEIAIKQLRQELGVQNSYIDELEDKLKRYERMDAGELKEFKKDLVVQQKNVEIQALQKTVGMLRKDVDRLINKLSIRDLGKITEHLKTE